MRVCLMVKSGDLQRAREVVDDLLSAQASDVDDDAQLDDDSESPQPFERTDAPPFGLSGDTPRMASGPPPMPPAIHPGCLLAVRGAVVLLGIAAS
jgi:hypothetical protein